MCHRKKGKKKIHKACDNCRLTSFVDLNGYVDAGGLVQHLLAEVLAVGHPVGRAVLEVVHVDVADLGEHEGGVVVVLGDGGLRRLA